MKKQCKSILSLMLCLAILVSCINIVSAAVNLPKQTYFYDDFSSGTLNNWSTVGKDMDISSAEIKSAEEKIPYNKYAVISDFSVILSPKKSVVKENMSVYEIEYVIKGTAAAYNASAPLKIYAYYKDLLNHSFYNFYTDNTAVKVEYVSVSGRYIVAESAARITSCTERTSTVTVLAPNCKAMTSPTFTS